MLYCIYHQFPLARRFDFGVDENFVERVVMAYLKGKSEITFKGRDYSIGSTALQIYEAPPELGSQKQVQDFFNQMGYVYDGLLEKYCRNVTDRFLLDREWGELKEDYYNIYINDGEKKPIVLVVNKKEVSSFLEEYAKGNTEILITGRTVNLANPKTIKIFSIDFKWLSKNRGKIKESINKMKATYGKWSTEVLKNFGTEVTSDFDVKRFGSMKISEVSNQSMNNYTSNTNQKTQIFISHSSKNEFVVKKFVDIILDNALGFDTSLIFCTSIEGLGIKSGEDFKVKIKTELLKSKVVIQMISKDYKASEVCLNEMGAAWVLTDDVIPFILDDKYDIGFIHSSNQQLKINSKKDILQFIDDRSSLFPQKSGHAKINRHVDDFINIITNGKSFEKKDVMQFKPIILILSATYAWPTGQEDITENFRDLIARGIYRGKVEPGTFGIVDPIYGQVKTLKVHYKLNEEEKSLSVRDGGVFNLLEE